MKNLLSAALTTFVGGVVSVIGLCVGCALWESKVEPWVDKKLKQLSLRGEKRLGGNFGSFLFIFERSKNAQNRKLVRT